MTSEEHARGLVNYYNARFTIQDGHSEWRYGGLKTAERFLALAQNPDITAVEVQDLLDFIRENRDGIYRGSVRLDLEMGGNGLLMKIKGEI